MEDNKNQNSDITLNPDGTANYVLNAQGELSGTYMGNFTFKTFLTPLEQLGASRAYRDLIGPNAELASDQDKFLSFALSQLKYRVIKAPPFWKTDSLYDGNINDLNILSLILEKAISSELLYKEHLKKKKEEALEKSQEVIKAFQEKMKPTKKERK